MDQSDVIGHTIDWDSIEITPLEESQIDAPENLMGEETIFAFVGLTLEKHIDAIVGMNCGPIVDEIMDISVDDRIPNEENVFPDMDDPSMDVGTIYANMNDFSRAVKQHAIKTQLMRDEKQVKVCLNKGEHFYSYSGGVSTIHYSTIYAGSVVEIGLKETEDGVYYQRFFCCFKPSINGFLNGCRPYLSVDATALNDACKGLENVVKVVFPWEEHRECFIHLMKNFFKRFQEVWNNWVKDLPIAELVDSLRSRFMELYALRRDIGERLEGHATLPIVVRHLNVLSRQLGHLKIKVGGRGEAEVTKITYRYKVLPPLKKRASGRQRKNRIPGCLEGKGNKSRTKGM
ncbi:hypothetical protein AAHA92_15339 [Salvia divinorum]|uniref:MULE transposase domain-containing protein n=1 Tax=Salvia divinorum TaxID=28513 RepID=A0ABD1HEF6_SALDI